MKITLWGKETAASQAALPPAGEPAEPALALSGRVSQRRFLKTLGSAARLAGLAGLGQAALAPGTAHARYVAASAPDGGDLVTTSLTVQGTITVNAVVAVHATGVAKQTRYAP